MNIFKIWRDLLNYFFLLSQIKKSKNTTNWSKFNLNWGYIGQIWMVINLPKEDMGETEETQNYFISERIKPIMIWLKEAYPGIEELLYLRLHKIPKTYGWLIVFWPKFAYISKGLIIRWIIAILLIWSLFVFTPLWDGIIWSWNWIINWVVNLK